MLTKSEFAEFGGIIGQGAPGHITVFIQTTSDFVKHEHRGDSWGCRINQKQKEQRSTIY